jgi:Bacteriophage head to tail connecting protein
MPYPPFSATNRYSNRPMEWDPSKLGDRSDDQKAKDTIKYLQLLAEQRLFWEPQIDNIILYVNHGRRFIQDASRSPGQQTGQEIFDDTAMLARNMLVDGMVGYLCSRNQPWFALELPGKFNFPAHSGMRAWNGRRVDAYPQVQRWLQDSQTVMYSAFNRSNFYDVVTEFISDGATCGTAHLVIEEDVEHASQVFTVPHFRECFIAENQYGSVDTCYRVYRMTLRQLADKFGMEEMNRIDANFQKEYESNMHAEHQILHAIYPRKDYFPSRVDGKAKQWESVWVYAKGGKLIQAKGETTSGKDVHLLSEGGYDSMPIITWRWRKNCDEVYGRGPAHDAFVSIAQLNQMGRTNLVTAHRSAEPPLVAYADLRGAIQRGPNGITYMEANRGDIRMRMPQPLYTGVQSLPFNIEYQDRVAKIVNQHFHTDVFMMMSQLAAAGKGQRMVVDQVNEMQSEKAAILGTRVGNLQSEAFDPLISRVYSIEAAAGRIPQPPDILLETVHGPVEVQYLGPLAQAQTRMTTMRSIQMFNSVVTELAQINPTAIDYVDIGNEIKLAAQALDVPIQCIRDDRMVAAIQQQRNQMAAQEQKADMAVKLSKAAANAAKAPEQDSPLKALMEGGDSGGA